MKSKVIVKQDGINVFSNKDNDLERAIERLIKKFDLNFKRIKKKVKRD